jgi:DNA-binding HxlR family transcriptional regulator
MSKRSHRPHSLISMCAYTGRVSRVVELLQGKWTIQILCAMREHPVRLSELKRAIPSASKKALTASLRSLEAARVVLRRDLSSSVLHVEYELADTMREPLVALQDIDVSLARHRVEMENGCAVSLLRPLRSPTTFLEN